VFAYPDLFRIRADLSRVYGQSHFSDREGNAFTLVGRRDYSVVIPDSPFSLIDLVPNLKKQGFSRFILDLSNAEPTRGFYRDIARAADQFRPLTNTSRFNWKDGFWSEETARREEPAQSDAGARPAKNPRRSVERSPASGRNPPPETRGHRRAAKNTPGARRPRKP
jgi:hypothetical protein